MMGKVNMRAAGKILLCVLLGFLVFSPLSSGDGAGGIGQGKDSGDALVQSGKALLTEGKFNQAISLFEQALETAQKLGDKKKQLACLMYLGVLNWNIGQIEESDALYRQGLALAKELGLKREQDLCRAAVDIYRLYTEGVELRNNGEFQKAIVCFQETITLAEKVFSREHKVKCLRQLSIVYWRMSDLDSFYELTQQGLKLARTLKTEREICNGLINLRSYYSKLNDHSKALSVYFQSLEIARKLNNQGYIATNLSNLANVYRDFGSFRKAQEYFEEALKIDMEAKDDRFIAMDYNNLGFLFHKKALISLDEADYSQAIDYFKRCLDFGEKAGDKKTTIRVLNNIGNLYLDLEQNQKALQYLKKGLAEAEGNMDLEAKAMLLSNIGLAYLNLKRWPLTEKYLKQAVALGQQMRAYNVLWEAYFGVGGRYEYRHMFLEAEEYFKKAIEVIEQVRRGIILDVNKAGYNRDKLQVYEHLLGLYFRLYTGHKGRDIRHKMFLLAEKAKAGAFQDIMAESKVDFRAKLSQELKDEEKDLSREISVFIRKLTHLGEKAEERNIIEQKLELAEDKYAALMSRIRIKNPELASLAQDKPCSVMEIQENILDKKSAIIEYLLGEQQSIMFIIASSKYEVFLLPGRKAIRRSLKAYLKELSESPNGQFKGVYAAQRLYSEFFARAEQVLPDSVKRVIIAPDGILCYLPFETLILPSDSESSQRDYLIHKYEISYIPSATALRLLLQNNVKQSTNQKLLAFGAPIYSIDSIPTNKVRYSPDQFFKKLYNDQGFDFSPLPYSADEVMGIAKMFPRNNRSIYLGEFANERIVKNTVGQDYSVIHFACHGFLDEQFPYRSALVLSLNDNKKEDGFFQVREIFNSRLKAEMVVLSACQTGRGALKAGEGILGLPRVFFYTGARSVVSTLWNIGDKPTARFMKFFYRYLARGSGKSQALSNAKLKMINSNFKHPFYWAPFVLNGDFITPIFLR